MEETLGIGAQGLFNLVSNTMEKSLAIAYFIIPLFILLTLVYQLWRGLVAGSRVAIDFVPLVRGFVIAAILFNYAEITGFIAVAVHAVYLVIIDGTDTGLYAELHGLSDLYWAFGLNLPAPDDSISPLALVQTFFEHLWNTFQDAVTLMGFMVSDALIMIIRELMWLIRTFLVSFLYIVGPLTIALSVIPGFQPFALRWVQAFISALAWIVTIGILDQLFFGVRSLIENDFIFNGETEMSYLVAAIGMIIMYLMVPFLTAYIVGQTAATAFASHFAGGAFIVGKLAGTASRLITKAAGARGVAKSWGGQGAYQQASSKGHGPVGYANAPFPAGQGSMPQARRSNRKPF